MYKRQLCLGTDLQFGIPITDQIRLFKKTGFDGFFTEWTRGEDIAAYKRTADEEGMIYQSIHAPFDKAAKMWMPQGEAKEAAGELLECLADCERHGVPIMVVHAFIGFQEQNPNDFGVENFREVVEAARKAHVKIAFENTEGEAYLEKLLTSFAEYDNVGFCWDTGHELCYNRGRDMLEKYGDRLFAMHLNDNLGIRDFGGKITWMDDLHLLPFDGVVDWRGVARRLQRRRWRDMLTFELVTKSKPGRHENDRYGRLPIEEYISEAYARACRVAAYLEQAQGDTADA